MGFKMKKLQLSMFGIKPVSLDGFALPEFAGRVTLNKIESEGLVAEDAIVTRFVERISLNHSMVSDDCPVILSDGRGSERRALAADINWELDSTVWPYWKPDLESCNAALDHILEAEIQL